jgi:hypothetical protein
MTASTPHNDPALKSIEADLDRKLEKLDEVKKAEEREEAAEQLAESKDDPTPLSDYKKAEAIKKGAI